jgi:hypothetical protein
VNLSLPQKKLQVLFPRFPGLAAALEVVLQEGDMLYLPAGWFHEVSSHGAGGELMSPGAGCDWMPVGVRAYQGGRGPYRDSSADLELCKAVDYVG